jgi:biotin operon repressor
MHEVINYIVTNKGNVNSAKTLGLKFGLADGTIRKIINEARSNGCPICSCHRGYYYSEKAEDIENTIRSLKHRILGIQNAINGLTFSLEVK